jgi:L-cystine uptake protein TcyP (sodium:dicarboxylate symporter family)
MSNQSNHIDNNKRNELEPCLNKNDKNNNNNNNDMSQSTGHNQQQQQQPLSNLQKMKSHLMTNLILVLTIVAIFGGTALGFLGRALEFSPTAVRLVAFPGELLLRLLKMLILPLIISSLITGLASLDPKSSGKMGSRALIFYFFSTILSTSTGWLRFLFSVVLNLMNNFKFY